MKIFRLLQFMIVLFALGFLGGCKDDAPKPVNSGTPAKTKEIILLEDPVQPELMELPAQALAFWNRVPASTPTLVLFSMHPFLQPIPEPILDRAKAMAKSGTSPELERHGSIFRLDPVILSQQTVSSAIEAELIRRLVWFFPFKETVEQLSLDHFREQVVQAGFFSAEDAATLALEEGVFSGRCRGLPIQIVHPDAYLTAEEAFPEFDGPLVVHFDLSYFRGLFQNNVKTPIYQLLNNTARLVRDLAISPQVTTLSFRTEEGEIGLTSRFLLRDLAELIENPQLLEGDMPEVWLLRQEAMFKDSMLEKSTAATNYRKMAELAPDDPSVQYDQFNLHMAAGQTDSALAALEKAIEEDPGYAFSYLELASYFAQNQQPDLALELLGKAVRYYPENPFIQSQTALLLRELGHTAEAEDIVADLLAQPWSTVYHQDARASLELLAKDLTGFLDQP